jgi:hypothetical protein
MARTSERSLLAPILGGLALIAGLILAIYFRAELWRGLKWVGEAFGTWVTDWIPAHPGETGAILGFTVFAFALNWFAHIRGRFRAWIFALVVEMGLWLLFWYGAGIPPLNELIGLNIKKLPVETVILSGVIVMAVTGAIFWYLEAREEWNKYRHRHDPD